MRVLAVDSERPDPRVVAEAARELREGRLVAFPTETVYGLGARAVDRDAVKRVFSAKGRPPTHPLIVHVLGEADAKRYAAEWPELASELAREFWPGPLTLVVTKAPIVPDEVTGGSPAVALRAPSHPVARALLEAVGEGVVAPSANRYQSLSPTRAEHVAASLAGEDVLLLDAGACPSGIESTVVDVRSDPPRVLRPGALAIDALRRVAPTLEFVPLEVAESAPRDSPGQAARHYAPRTPLVIERDARAHGGAGVAIVVFGGAPAKDVHVLPADPEAAGAALYALLHDLDARGYARIVVERPPEAPGWEAVADRLRRAAAR